MVRGILLVASFASGSVFPLATFVCCQIHQIDWLGLSEASFADGQLFLMKISAVP